MCAPSHDLSLASQLCFSGSKRPLGQSLLRQSGTKPLETWAKNMPCILVGSFVPAQHGDAAVSAWGARGQPGLVQAPLAHAAVTLDAMVGMCCASHGHPQPCKQQQEPPSFTLKEIDSFRTSEAIRNQGFVVGCGIPYHLSQGQPSPWFSQGNIASALPQLPPAPASAACFPVCSSAGAAFRTCSEGAISMLQGSCRQRSQKAEIAPGLPQVLSLEMPSQLLPAPRSCQAPFFHGKGYTGHFSYDLTLASAVSHRKPGPSGAVPELAEPMERPPRPLGPA